MFRPVVQEVAGENCYVLDKVPHGAAYIGIMEKNMETTIFYRGCRV